MTTVFKSQTGCSNENNTRQERARSEGNLLDSDHDSDTSDSDDAPLVVSGLSASEGDLRKGNETTDDIGSNRSSPISITREVSVSDNQQTENQPVFFSPRQEDAFTRRESLRNLSHLSQLAKSPQEEPSVAADLFLPLEMDIRPPRMKGYTSSSRARGVSDGDVNSNQSGPCIAQLFLSRRNSSDGVNGKSACMRDSSMPVAEPALEMDDGSMFSMEI